MPAVIALMGLPGSGKTTVAEALAVRRAFSLVSRDSIRAAMFLPCRFTEAEKEAAYAAMLRALAACLALGRSCVVEGLPFSRAREVADVRGLAEAAGARFLAVFLDCPVHVAQARARRDAALTGRPPEDRDAETVVRVAARFDPPPPDALRLDATLSPEALADAILEWLDRAATTEG